MRENVVFIYMLRKYLSFKKVTEMDIRNFGVVLNYLSSLLIKVIYRNLFHEIVFADLPNFFFLCQHIFRKGYGYNGFLYTYRYNNGYLLSNLVIGNHRILRERMDSYYLSKLSFFLKEELVLNNVSLRDSNIFFLYNQKIKWDWLHIVFLLRRILKKIFFHEGGFYNFSQGKNELRDIFYLLKCGKKVRFGGTMNSRIYNSLLVMKVIFNILNPGIIGILFVKRAKERYSVPVLLNKCRRYSMALSWIKLETKKLVNNVKFFIDMRVFLISNEILEFKGSVYKKKLCHRQLVLDSRTNLNMIKLNLVNIEKYND